MLPPRASGAVVHAGCPCPALALKEDRLKGEMFHFCRLRRRRKRSANFPLPFPKNIIIGFFKQKLFWKCPEADREMV